MFGRPEAVYVDPDVVVRPDGGITMYIVYSEFESECGGRGCQRIRSAHSDDGLSFTMAAGDLLTAPNGKVGLVDPDVYQDADGDSYMLYGEMASTSGIGLRVAILSATSTPSPAPTPEPTAAPPDPPTITTEAGAASIVGAQVWLFVVDDGMPRPAVSSEANGEVWVGRLDLDNPSGPITWQPMVGPEDVDGARIADHWHVFAHGFHWIAFSANADEDSYLLKLDQDFNRIALINVAQNSDIPTNDLFLVSEPDGVTVGHFLPGTGHRLFRFDVQGALIGTIDIGGSQFFHSNGASAIGTASGYSVLAPENLNPVATSAIKELEYDNSWNPIKSGFLADDDGTHYSMPSGVRLDTGYQIVNVKVIEGVNPRGVFATASTIIDDSGSLIRLIVSPDGGVVDRQVLESSGVNRPHTTLIGDRLITTWDGPDTGGRIRIDRVTE